MLPGRPRRLSVPAPTRPPRLVLLFSILTALGIAAAAAVILVAVRGSDATHAEAHATERARFAAQAVLAPELRTSDVRGALPDRRRKALTRLLRARALENGIRAIALYGPRGERTYAVGETTAPVELSAQRQRETFAGRQTISETIREADGSPVLRTYVPVAEIAGRVQGVAVVEQAVGSSRGSASRSLAIATVLEALLVLLFVALVPVLARASARIDSHIAELEHVARHDELTALPNRLGIAESIDAALESHETVVIALVDIDGFSELNASLGSECGDRVLAEAGGRLVRELADRGAAVGRSGDDEFCIVAPDNDGHARVDWLEPVVRRAFRDPFVIDGVRIAVDVDIGVAVYPEHGTDGDALIGCAAAALVAAKGESRSSTRLYEAAAASKGPCRLTVAAELRSALETHELCVHYQPQLDLLTNRIRGVEALVRWNHPERGLLAGGEFIEDVERSGLSQELRRYVLTHAARQWAEWDAAGASLALAVNIDAVDILDPALPGEVADILVRHGIPPHALILEVTERTLVADDRRTRAILDDLRGLKVRLSIDDFGTGYSALGSLRTLPVHEVKLDKSLLADVPGDEVAESIVGGSVEIAHGVGALVVAEGIETHEQLRFASTVGCDIAQGYLVGAPVPGAEILERMARVVPLDAARRRPGRNGHTRAGLHLRVPGR